MALAKGLPFTIKTMVNKLAENLRTQENETTAHERISDKQFMEGLRPEEVKKIQKKQTSIHKVREERDQLENKANSKLAEIKRQNTAGNEVLNDWDEYNLRAKIRDTNSPKDMEDLIKEIEGIPEAQKKAQETKSQEEKPLNPEDEKLMALEKDFHDIVDNNKDLIGENQIREFKDHITEQRKEKPTIAHMKDQIKRLQGQESTDPNGLHPRRLEFHRHQFLFRKYKIGSGPLSNDYIKKQGLSERTKFRENCEDMEDKLQKMQKLGIYSDKAITAIMQEMLKATTAERQTSLLTKTTRICNQESSGLTRLDSTINIEGKSIRKMSAKSKRKYFEYYADQNLDHREKLVPHWEKLVANEAKLANEFADLYKKHYKNDPAKMQENLYLALTEFDTLDFLEKKDAIKEHKSMLEKEKDAEKTTRRLEIKAAHTAIDEEETLSKKTKQNYKDWYNQKFDNDTSKLEDLKIANKSLISKTPDEKLKNLAAYAQRHAQYNDRLKKLRDIKPDMTDAEYEAYKDKFQSEGWENREKLQETLESDISKAQKEAAELRTMKAKADIEDDDLDNLETATLETCLKQAKKLILQGQAAEALKQLASFENPGHPEIVKAMKAAVAFLDAFGGGEAANDNIEQEAEKAMEARLKSDETLKDEMLEEQITTLNIEGTEQSIRKNDNVVSLQERADKEALGSTADETEKKMVKSFNEQRDNDYILNEDLTGEKITRLEISDNATDKTDLKSLKRRTEKEQNKLNNEEGILTEIEDKSGRKVTPDEAKALQEKNLDRMEQEMAEQALKDVEGKKALGSSVTDLNSRIAARRKARSLIDEKRHQKLEKAA